MLGVANGAASLSRATEAWLVHFFLTLLTQVTSLEAIYQTSRSSFWSHERLYHFFHMHAEVLLNAREQTLMREIDTLPR